MARSLVKNANKSKPKFRWEVEPEAIKKACRELGIDNPQNIKIRRTSHSRRGGCCQPRKVSGIWYYYITANKHCDHYDAVRILLHELRHVWQHQQHRKNTSSDEECRKKWNFNANRNTYLNRPLEIDARRAEKRTPEFMDIVSANW